MRPRGRNRQPRPKRGPRKNEQIRLSPVQVIDENGENQGEMETKDAIALARSKGLDLVEVGAKSRPPICKIVNYGKWKYDLDKTARLKRQQSKTVKSEVKGVRITFGASEHDLAFRAKQAKAFLEEGHMVRVEMRLRGREKGKKDLAKQRMHEFLTIVDVPVKIQQEPKRGGRGFEMLVIRDKKAAAAAQQQNQESEIKNQDSEHGETQD